ncbi:MAG: tripartite tricarboxylate transporter substrate binding protein [Betaproteobacteria bacterium]|nr:tripartite tricarboxylate transporter substrate binding protein [Betaproteobacteria bacterium]
MKYRLLVLCTLLLSTAAHAQSYPNKPVRLIVPFPAGGPADITARVIAPKVSEGLAQNLVIENRAGGSAIIGSEFVAKSPADGYTLLLGTVTNTINVSLIPKIPYDMVRDFEPVGQLYITTSIFTAHPSLPVKTVKELIALAKARPGQLIYGSAGNGSPSHLAGELLKTMSSIQMLHVPYKGGGPAAIEQVAGQVQLAFLSAPAVVPFIKEGRLRALAVTNAKRSQIFPDLPTLAEAALPGYESEGWSAVFAPAKTPAAIVQRLHRDFASALRDNDVRAKLVAAGTEPAMLSPEDTAKKVRNEIERWGKVVKASGMKVD